MLIAWVCGIRGSGGRMFWRQDGPKDGAGECVVGDAWPRGSTFCRRAGVNTSRMPPGRMEIAKKPLRSVK
jgi:hypothetical protein